MYKTAFSARDQQNIFAFLQFSAVLENVQNSVFSPRSARFVIFALGAPLFCDFQQRARECTKQRFQPCSRSTRFARFVIFALGAPLFCNFQQRARGCTKQRFQPEISTFCHFCTGRTTFLQFSATCSSMYMYKTAFSARDQISTFCHFCTGRTTFL